MKDRDDEPQEDAAEAPPVDFANDEDVSRGFRRAVREALAAHALRKNKVVVWKNGRPAWVRPKPKPESGA